MPGMAQLYPRSSCIGAMRERDRIRSRTGKARPVGGPGPLAAVSHGGVTVDLMRTLASDAALPPRLLRDGIPACAISTLDDLGVVTIASTAHLFRVTLMITMPLADG